MAKYFLYIHQQGPNFKSVIHPSSASFTRAEIKKFDSEEMLVSALALLIGPERANRRVDYIKKNGSSLISVPETGGDYDFTPEQAAAFDWHDQL